MIGPIIDNNTKFNIDIISINRIIINHKSVKKGNSENIYYIYSA